MPVNSIDNYVTRGKMLKEVVDKFTEVVTNTVKILVQEKYVPSIF